MELALIDYNMGNLGSVCKALEQTGAAVRVIAEPAGLDGCPGCVLPGVGNFGDGMENLRRSGFDRALKRFAANGGLVFGICLGMQMLLEASEEAPGVAGMGVLPGTVRRFPSGTAKVPHMGWNSVRFAADSPLRPAPETAEEYFYFVHTYYVPPRPEYTDGVCEYILPFAAALRSGNWFATQFHPEKSQRAGLKLLRNFAALAAGDGAAS